MRKLPVAVLILTIALGGCRWRRHARDERQALTPTRAAVVQEGVRAFARSVADAVTKDGPSAWARYFQDTPQFFMVVNGQMAFPSGVAAITAIPQVAKQIPQITLTWGDDLRVDPLTPDLAVFAAPYHESLVLADARHVESNGYFTSVVELTPAGWKFRNAHWSEPLPQAPVAKVK